MNEQNLKKLFSEILKPAGVKINGRSPWDIQVHDSRLYNRVMAEGTLGFGEAYMDGWWDCDQLDELIARVLRINIYKYLRKNPKMVLDVLRAKVLNAQTKVRSKKVIREHYNLGNDLFEAFLDPNMQYTCGYWKNTQKLDQAQVAKLDLICQKLQLKPGMTLLDIGCGWGNLANFAAENYGAKVTGITISEEQLKYCKEHYKSKNLKFLLKDYRDMTGSYDRIATVGMIEHVGYKNYNKFMKIVDSLLNKDGIYLLHTIGNNKSAISTDLWIDKYIFPGSLLPSVKQLAEATEGLMVMEDWHNFGADYDKTLLAWMKNFDKSWPTLKKKYDERFYRMWRYYLLMCAGSFRARNIQLWQIVFSKNGLPGGYKSIR